VDSVLTTDAQSSATLVHILHVCSTGNSVCSSNDHMTARLHSSDSEVNAGTDMPVTACVAIVDNVVQSDLVIDDLLNDDSDKVNMDIQDLSSAVDPLLETTLEYSICSDTHDGIVGNKCETQNVIGYYVESATEPVINLEKNPVASSGADTPVTSGIQKTVDLVTVPNSVNVDLRNNATVCSPLTLMVV